jgi:hypothetical protein
MSGKFSVPLAHHEPTSPEFDMSKAFADQSPNLPSESVKGRRVRLSALIAFVTAALLAPLAPVAAQDTRAEAVRKEQAEKKEKLAPPRPNAAERVINRLEEWGLLTGAPRGLYPWFGSVYPGGGFAAGAGVRVPFADDGAFNVFGSYSIATFSRAQADLTLPSFASGRARISLTGRYVNAPDVRYFGVGNFSSKENATRFGYTPKVGGARLDLRGGKYFSVGGGVNYLDIETSAGRTAPSIEQRFSPGNTPGLGISSFTYINSTAQAALDWRRPLGYSGRGGMYRVQLDDYRERDNDLYSFRSAEAELLQLIPILRANWVIALRGLATVTDIDETSAVPFFMLPSIGGGSTLRGYPDFRFRDRNRLVLNAELRWTPARFMDMAIFYDTGKVASRREDLDFDDLKESYGIGVRFIGMEGYVMRLEVAHSREHAARLLFSAGGAF